MSTIACASIQASWTLGNCFLNMFLNMLDTLVGAGAYAILSPRRAHLLPKIGLLYTHHVLSATQFDALKRAKPSVPLPEQSTSVLGQSRHFNRAPITSGLPR